MRAGLRGRRGEGPDFFLLIIIHDAVGHVQAMNIIARILGNYIYYESDWNGQFENYEWLDPLLAVRGDKAYIT